MDRQSNITFRELHTHAEYDECVAIQKETWGAPFTEIVAASVLMISQKVGGIVAGAFEGDRMIGFVFGLTGIMHRKPVHWSHMLAVRDATRGSGLGQQLKWYQRELLLKMGVEVVYWTFDPLVSRNAHLNLNRLGARISAYVPDHYGADTDSELHSGLGTDRFIALWRLRDQRVKRAKEGKTPVDYARYANAPVVDAVPGAHGESIPEHLELIGAPAVRIEVPPDIQALKKRDSETAWKWRLVTRRAFQHYLSLGYAVEGIYRDGNHSFYVMTRGRGSKAGSAKTRRGTRRTGGTRGRKRA
jgi:predicted GNAT superfamily acetyltransferase